MCMCECVWFGDSCPVLSVTSKQMSYSPARLSLADRERDQDSTVDSIRVPSMPGQCFHIFVRQ